MSAEVDDNTGMPHPGVVALGETVRAFAAFMSELPSSAVRPHPWGAREVLCHIVFWHEAYVRILSALVEGRRPRSFHGPFSALNARAVVRLAAVPIPVLVARLLKAQARLERLEPLARQRRLRIAVKAEAMQREIGPFLARVEAHIRSHHVALRRQLRRAA